MEEAYSAVRGLPAVVEGDCGIYEAETMPVAPLLRRQDGTAMGFRQYVYGPLHEYASTNPPANEFTDTNTTSHGVPDQMAPNTEVTPRGPDLTTPRSTKHDELAMDDLVNFMKTHQFPNGVSYKTARDRLNKTTHVGDQQVDAFGLLVRIISMEINMTSGESLTDDEKLNLITLMMEDCSMEGHRRRQGGLDGCTQE